MAEKNLRRWVLSDLKGIQKTSTDVRFTAKRLETLIRNRKVEPTTNTFELVRRDRKYVIRAKQHLSKETARLIARSRK